MNNPYEETADTLRDFLRREGYRRCDIPACNCGSWHGRDGLHARWREVKDALEEAGHGSSNENGRLVSRQLAALIADRDRLRAALEKYGRHAHPNCHDLVGPSARVRHGCLCGLDAALAGAERGDVPASAPLTDDERALCEVIDERDTAHELLDRFAAAIGAMLGEEFGEHSSGNDPWANALEAIEA